MKQLTKSTGMGIAILQKELIVRFRRFRSLIVQLIFAAVLGGSMWMFSLGSGIGGAVSPEDHAQSLVVIYFGVQLGALFLIIPALGAVSITTERLGRTWDLLIGTDLSPGEIVRGKLLGILSMTFYFMFLPAPLLALTTLFGGVSIGSILFEYFVHMLVALLLGSCSLLSSAASKGTARAILQVYPLAALGLIFSLAFLTNEVYDDGLLILDYLLLNPPTWEFWLIMIPLYLFALTGTLLGATYFLSGVESAREIPVRMMFVVFFLTAVGIYWYAVTPTPSGGNSLTRYQGEFLLVCLGFVPLILLRLAGSPSRVPLRVAQIYQKGNPLTRIGYFILPGGIRNLIFSILLFSIPFVLVWILRDAELKALSQVSPNFDGDAYQLKMANFVDLIVSMYLWGISLLSLCWFLAQSGFGSIVSSVLAIGTHVALTMVVVTMSVVGGGTGPASAIAFLSPLVAIISTANDLGTTETLLSNANWFSGICIMVLVTSGIFISKMKGLPVLKVQRPGMDNLYLELPKEVS